MFVVELGVSRWCEALLSPWVWDLVRVVAVGRWCESLVGVVGVGVGVSRWCESLGGVFGLHRLLSRCLGSFSVVGVVCIWISM